MDHLERLEADQRWIDLCAALDGESAGALAATNLLRRARARWQCGRYDDSLADFEVAADRFRGPDTLVALAKAEIGLAAFDRAGDRLQSAAAQAPDHAEAVFLASLDSYRRDAPDVALRRLARLVRRHPAWQPARVALWQVARVCGRPGEATERLGAFPGTDFERAQAESFEWFGTAGAWLGFSPEVLVRAVEVVSVGDLIVECGVFHGRSIRRMAPRTALPIHGFDSFEGLPEAWGHYPAGTYSTGGTMPRVPDQATLHAGWFEDTLPRFAAEHDGRQLALLHVDCDLYSSTVTVLDALQPLLGAGTVLVFDDLLGYPDFRSDEFRALDEFRARTGWTLEPIAAALVGREAALRIAC